jgi:hypothetical protein
MMNIYDNRFKNPLARCVWNWSQLNTHPSIRWRCNEESQKI